MDIVTHAAIGLVAAAPFMASNQELAAGLLVGSVLPDLDAMSRVFGKRAYLRSHQTWSHALPVQAAVSFVIGLAADACGANGWMLGLGMFAGLALHTLLDFSNTLGVTLFAPFSRRRRCLEWVFFIDAIALGITGATVGWMLWCIFEKGEGSAGLAITYFGMMGLYFFARGLLRWRAGRLVPDAVSLMPSALWPWQFLGATADGSCVRLFVLNVITGDRKEYSVCDILDGTHASRLAAVPEFALMRELSPAYHVVSACPMPDGERIICRDLRTRNFATTFGDLEVLFDAQKKITRTNFHV
jgi:membrane-bound metal-dependent hydrolase YbcI (DUF457 family)